jgi:hypothetical protein
VHGADQIARHGTGGIGVAGVVHRQQQRRAHIAGPGRVQSAIDRDGQALLRDPPLADLLHLFGGDRPLGQLDRPGQCFHGFRARGMGPKLIDRLAHRDRQLDTGHHAIDQCGERARGQISGGMSVGQLRGPCRCGERLVRPHTGQPERRGPHHRAAAFRMRVHRTGFAQRRRREVSPRLLVQTGHTRVPRCARRVQEGQTRQPPVDVRRGLLLTLGLQPAQIRSAQRGHRIGTRLRPQQSLRGEQRHLGVVGDLLRCVHGVLRQEARHPVVAVALPNLLQPQEFDGPPQRVPHRSAQQRTAHPIEDRRVIHHETSSSRMRRAVHHHGAGPCRSGAGSAPGKRGRPGRAG